MRQLTVQEINPPRVDTDLIPEHGTVKKLRKGFVGYPTQAEGEPPPEPVYGVGMKRPTRPDWAVVLGGGQCVWRGLAGVERMIGREWPGLYIVINDLGCVWTRRIDHWVSLHPENFPEWLPLREENGHPGGYVTWTQGRGGRPVKHGAQRWVRQWAGGSSGMLGVTVAYTLGCAKVILCGVPMDGRPHFRESVVHHPNQPWSAYGGHKKAWIRERQRLLERTRSMTGFTRELLGPPTPSWLGTP